MTTSAAILPFRTKKAVVSGRDRKAALAVLLPVLRDCARKAVTQIDGPSVWRSSGAKFFVRSWSAGPDGLGLRVDQGFEPLLTLYISAGKASVSTWKRGWEAAFLDAAGVS